MLKKYCVDYSLRLRGHSVLEHQQYFTDDPVTCESFVAALLEHGLVIHAIRHDGVELPKHEFDRMVKVAAAAVASKLICLSLSIKPEEAHYRFGFAA